MASNWTHSAYFTQPVAGRRTCAKTTDKLPKEVKDCLVDRSLCLLMSMGPRNRPKSRSALENALGPCTAEVPYISPLDALTTANKSTTQPTLSVSVPHAKKRVYTTLEKLKAAHKHRRLTMKLLGHHMWIVAPLDSDIENAIMDDAITWIKSNPEGTEDSLVNALVRRCEKELDCSSIALKHLLESGELTMDESGKLLYSLPSATSSSSGSRTGETLAELLTKNVPSSVRPSTVSTFLEAVKPKCKVIFTVPPARLFGMNLRRIKHREVEEDKGDESSKQSKAVRGLNTESTPKRKTEFAVGVQPGENAVREQISITPRGLTGIEVSVTGQVAAPLFRKPTGDSTQNPDNERLRAVGQCKGLSRFFTNRLTVAVRNHNAVLVPANEQEKKYIISKVAGWITSLRRGTPANQPMKTVAKLQEELANMCVGQVQHLAPSTLTDLLLTSGYIFLDSENSVTYRLPTDREAQTWQQRTVEAAAKSCNCSSLLRKAFPRPRKGKDEKGKDRKGSKTKTLNSLASLRLFELQAALDNLCDDQYDQDDMLYDYDYDYADPWCD